MRTLSSTLEAAQKASSGVPYLCIVVGSETFGVDRVLKIEHEEQPHRETATIILNNSDGYLTEKNLRGNEVTIGLGFRTSAGNEYSNGFPLRVISQSFQSIPNKLTCELNCVGVANELTEDRADERYVPTTETIQTLASGILEGTLTPFDQCPAYTVSYGALDGLIDTVKPADSFRIYVNSSRLAALRRLLDFTYCVMRPEGDEAIHIFKPTLEGEVYDYEYALNTHVFYAKTQSNTITIPNHIVVRTPVDADPAYSGEATDDESIAAYKTIKYYEIVAGLTSDAQAQSIAEAILSKFQMHDVMAGATVPINVGAEIYDYIKITDAREGTSVTGNIGYIRTVYQAGTLKPSYTQTFGLGGWLSTRRREIELEVGGLPGEGTQYQAEMVVDTLYLNPINLDWIEDGTNFSRVQSGALSAEGLVLLDEVKDEAGTYSRTLASQLSAHKLLLSDECAYSAGYDPSTKWEGSDLDDLPDGSNFKRVAATDISAGHILLSEVIQTSTYRTVSDGNKTTWNNKPDNMDEIGEGSTFQRVRATDISSGHIKLSSYTEVDGEWYDEGGVEIDASSGINIYGTDQAFTTRATKTGTIQCKVDSSGAIVAGAGNVILDADGMTVFGEALRFKYGSVIAGYIRVLSDTQLLIRSVRYLELKVPYPLGELRQIYGSNTICITDGVGVRPGANNTYKLGSSSFNWETVYAQILDLTSGGYIDNSSRTSYPAAVGGRQCYRSDIDRIKGYVDGAWRNMTT